MPELLEIPRRAIAAFEAVHGLQVVVHDFANTLAPYIAHAATEHRCQRCVLLKHSPLAQRCFDFDLVTVPEALDAQPHGRWHICHAGLVEWVVPAWRGGEREWIVFASQAAPGPGLTAPRVRRSPERDLPWPDDLPPLQTVDDERAAIVLEGLHQLVARLQAWRQELEQTAAEAPAAAPGPGDHDRRAFIQRFIAVSHPRGLQLADLAAALHLSPGRTAHLVRELFGRPWLALLDEARLRTARGLLTTTSLPLLDVALRSGFGDLRQFHRVFRKNIGQSPGRFRKQRPRVP